MDKRAKSLRPGWPDGALKCRRQRRSFGPAVQTARPPETRTRGENITRTPPARELQRVAAAAAPDREVEGARHFSGEHTSIDFQGYLNRAVETGERAADEVIGALP
jgi:Flavin containing amine oxidoreductase